MGPDEIVDRADACQILGISRQTLMAWIRKGKIKVLKRVGHGSNAALLFDRDEVERLLLTRASERSDGMHGTEQISENKAA